MSLKKCKVCGMELTTETRYNNMTTGLLCKEHFTERRIISRRKYLKEYDKTEKRRADKIKSTLRQREKHPEKMLAVYKVGYAVKKGILL